LNRRTVIGWLLAFVSTKAVTQTTQKYYITGLGGRPWTANQNDCTIPPITSHGTSRRDALMQMIAGATVWTEDEWLGEQKSSDTFGFRKAFDQTCKDIRQGLKP